MQLETQQTMESPLKQAASRVLARNSTCNNRATVSLEGCNSAPSPELRELHDEHAVIAEHDSTLTRQEAEAMARAIEIRRMRERGEIPEHYTAVTVCRHCGPVPIFPGAPGEVEGCPWCFNRTSGRPVPRAEPMGTQPPATLSVRDVVHDSTTPRQRRR